MADVSTTAKNKVEELGNTCAQAASNASEGLRNAAGYVADQAKDFAGSASQKAEDATAAIGSRLRAAGDAIRQSGPHDGRMGQASSAVAQTLSNTGEYLEREGLQGIEHEITGMIKRNPIPALLMGIGLGFLIAQATARRS